MDAEIRLACVDLETGRQFNLLHDSAEGATRGVRIWQATVMRGAVALRQARVDAKAIKALRKETFEVARLAVLAEQQAARLRASQGQPSAGDEALSAGEDSSQN